MFLMETPTDSQIRWQNLVMWQGIRTAQEHIAHVLAAQHSCENAAVKVSIAISFKPCKCIKKVFSIKLSKHIDFILYYLSMQTDIIKIGPSQNANPKLCPATDSLTGVKCRATSVAKNICNSINNYISWESCTESEILPSRLMLWDRAKDENRTEARTNATW